MKEREAVNPGATMYTHWMKTVQENSRTTREKSERGDEEILRPESDPPGQQRDR